MNQECIRKLKEATRQRLRKFNSLRGKLSMNLVTDCAIYIDMFDRVYVKYNKLLPGLLEGREVQPGQFWDVVVVTAVDGSQRESYELQISEKLDRKELPLSHYKVFSDPPGSKIGK